MLEVKRRALRCPCGRRLEADSDHGLAAVLRAHIEREHPYAEPPPEERVADMVSSTSYYLEYVPVEPHDGLEEEGFGPEPY